MSLVNIILISWIPHKQDQWRNKVGAAIGADAPGGTFWRAAFSTISVLKTLTYILSHFRVEIYMLEV